MHRPKRELPDFASLGFGVIRVEGAGGPGSVVVVRVFELDCSAHSPIIASSGGNLVTILGSVMHCSLKIWISICTSNRSSILFDSSGGLHKRRGSFRSGVLGLLLLRNRLLATKAMRRLRVPSWFRLLVFPLTPFLGSTLTFWSCLWRYRRSASP